MKILWPSMFVKKVAGHFRESNPIPVNQEYHYQCRLLFEATSEVCVFCVCVCVCVLMSICRVVSVEFVRTCLKPLLGIYKSAPSSVSRSTHSKSRPLPVWLLISSINTALIKLDHS